jgi:putative intracellular protease/amidase
MAPQAIYLLVFEGFADWEPAHAIAELRRNGGYRVESVATGISAVQSMGGLTILPSRTLSSIDPADVAAFVLPGGDRWEQHGVPADVEAALKALDAADVPIAAICAATTAVARVGLLRGRRHTSNSLGYLRSHVPSYSEAHNYVDLPAVRDRKLITASGLGDIEFARELMEELNVLSPDERKLWAQIFRTARLPTGA